MLRGAPTAISQSIAEGLRSCEQSTSFPKRVEQPARNRCRTDPLKELERQVCVPEPETQSNPRFNHQAHPICYFNLCPTPLKSLSLSSACLFLFTCKHKINRNNPTSEH